MLGLKLNHVSKRGHRYMQDYLNYTHTGQMPPHINCSNTCPIRTWYSHDDVIKWEHFPRYWPFVQIIHRSLVNFPDKSKWRRALMFSLILAWINCWVNNGEACDLRRHRAHYGIIAMNQHASKWVFLSRSVSPSQSIGNSTACSKACWGKKQRMHHTPHY